MAGLALSRFRGARYCGGTLHSDLFQRRFIIVCGKGGVGKSTVCMALGLAAARAGRRTCIVQLNTRDAIGRFFGRPPIEYEPRRLDNDLPLFGCNLRPRQALREYSLMKLRFAALHRLVFENEVMRRLLGMVPGMTETLLLGKAWFMEEMAREQDGRPTWDTLVIDAPSTGHGVALFRLPEVIMQAVPVGPMAEDARRMHALLADPERTSFNIATLPLELPVNEALDLQRQADQIIGLPTGYIFANMVLPQLLDDAAMAPLQRLAASEDPLVAASATNAATFARWRDAQQHQLARLRTDAKMPIMELPHLMRAMDRRGIEELSEMVEAAAERPREVHA